MFTCKIYDNFEKKSCLILNVRSDITVDVVMYAERTFKFSTIGTSIISINKGAYNSRCFQFHLMADVYVYVFNKDPIKHYEEIKEINANTIEYTFKKICISRFYN